MSKATDYLVQQIHDKDALINTLIAQQRDHKALAFEEGWHEHYLQFDRQKSDPTHPITKNNPYTRASN